jgi:hypothetical protein
LRDTDAAVGRGGGKGRRRGDREREVPIPLEAVDLLAGLAPGVELCADDLPPGIDPELSETATPATVTVTETGRLLRAGDETVRRLIRTPLLAPDEPPRPRSGEVDRAGVPPRTPDKPGE